MNKKPEFACPCCGYKTLEILDEYRICQVCFWEDDPFQKDNPTDPDGPNWISLIEAQKNYLTTGAIDQKSLKNIRKPKLEEKRDPNWKPFKENIKFWK